MHRGIGFYTKIGLSVFIFLALTSYVLYQSRKVIGGPIITLSSPIDGITTSSSTVSVAGTTSDSSNVTIDGNAIVIDESGNFKEDHALLPGLNIITVRAENQFKRNSEKTLRVVYKPSV